MAVWRKCVAAASVAAGVGSVRHMAVAANGDLYLATESRGGVVVALRDADGDGKVDLGCSRSSGLL